MSTNIWIEIYKYFTLRLQSFLIQFNLNLLVNEKLLKIHELATFCTSKIPIDRTRKGNKNVAKPLRQRNIEKNITLLNGTVYKVN